MLALDLVISVIAGVSSLLAIPASMALVAAADRFELSRRVLVGVALFVACSWCLAEAIHLEANGPEAIMMVIAAAQSLSAVRAKRILRRSSDLSPFS